MVYIDFSRNGNSQEFIRSNWSNQEQNFRWSIEENSTICIPPVLSADRHMLIIDCFPFAAKNMQLKSDYDLRIKINGTIVGQENFRRDRSVYAFLVDRKVFHSDQNNVIEFLHPNTGRPSEYGMNDDSRMLSICWRYIYLIDANFSLLESPELLPEPISDTPESSIVFGQFQSLGQNCDFGLIQRKSGIEPLGLLRFASIFMSKLILGISTDFSGIDDQDKFSLEVSRDGSEFQGTHKIYGLDYHTFIKPNPSEKAAFEKKELRRLKFLSRILVEQICNDEKIFVRTHTQNKFEILSLLSIIRNKNPNARLLWVSPATENDEFDLIGKTQRLGVNFYRGIISPRPTGELDPFFNYAEWDNICKSVVRYENAAKNLSS